MNRNRTYTTTAPLTGEELTLHYVTDYAWTLTDSNGDVHDDNLTDAEAAAMLADDYADEALELAWEMHHEAIGEERAFLASMDY